MVKVLNRRLVGAGDVVFHEGDEGTQAYIVQTGLVRIEKQKRGAAPVILGHIRPGGIFGEMALIDRSPRMASAVAETNTTLISIPEESLRKKLKSADPVVKMMIQVMIRMIRAIAEQGNIGEKVVDELLKAAEVDSKDAAASAAAISDPRKQSGSSAPSPQTMFKAKANTAGAKNAPRLEPDKDDVDGMWDI